MSSQDVPVPQGSPRVLWTPKDLSASQMDVFICAVNRKFGLSIQSYQELYRWSIDEYASFWSFLLGYFDIIHSTPATTTVLPNEPQMFPPPEWFPGLQMNFAENLLLRRRNDDAPAVFFVGERAGHSTCLTFAQLFAAVSRCASALRQAQVGIGDVIAYYGPNTPEALITMLAGASIGAIFTAASADFGALAVLERFKQTKPKLLVSANAVQYNGKIHDHFDKLQIVVEGCVSIRRVVVIRFIDATVFDLTKLEKAVDWNDWLRGMPADHMSFVPLPFSHPLYIVYSSGTTGLPKCIIHSSGGTLLQHLKEHRLHGDMGPNDLFFQYTTVGWMMWQWMVSGLATGAAILLYDGSPLWPNAERIWEMIDRMGVTHFGTSAKYLQSLMAITAASDHKDVPIIERYRLSTLRMIFSTGSPLPANAFEFVYERVKKDVLLASITGGTDILSLFAGGNPLLPVNAGEIQCTCLGMAVEVWSHESGGSVPPGTPADLVCTRPFPSMPIGFWGDSQTKELYREAYFGKFGGKVWCHGDFIMVSPMTGGITMLGRSDGTLNPAGVRFGSADIYNIVNSFPQIEDSLAVGVRRAQDCDERVALFLKMASGQEFNDCIASLLRQSIREGLSPRHVPTFILEAPEIPYTINGKKVEVAIKRILSGAAEMQVGSLLAPNAVEFYRNLARTNALFDDQEMK